MAGARNVGTAFNGAGTLALAHQAQDNPNFATASYTGTISDFNSADTLDLGGFQLPTAGDQFTTSASYVGDDNATTLTVTDTTQNTSASVTLAGDYSNDIWTAISDGNGGVNVTETAPAPAPAVDLNGAAPGTSNAVAYLDQLSTVNIAPAATVTADNSDNFSGGSLTVAFSNGQSEDQLVIQNGPDVTVSGSQVMLDNTEIGTINATNNGQNGAALEIDLTLNATPAAITTLLEQIDYTDTSATPTTTTRDLTVSVTDGNGQTGTATATIAFPNLVANGGFETGDLSGWNQSGNPEGNNVGSGTPHSGNFALDMGAVGSDSAIDQTLSTVAGDTYQVQFWLADDGTPSDFSASFGGHTLLSLVNSAAQNYTEYTFDVSATGTSSDLDFAARNDPAYWHLDDISVVDVTGVPVITVPGAQTLAPGVATAVSGVSLAEAGAASGETFTVTLTDTTGDLSATQVGDGDTVTGSGTTLTIIGSLGDVNTDLATLTDTESTPGSDTIVVNANDGNGVDALQQTIAVTVNPANIISFSNGTINTNGNVTPQIGNGGSTLQLTDGNTSEAASWFANTTKFDHQLHGVVRLPGDREFGQSGGRHGLHPARFQCRRERPGRRWQLSRLWPC